MLMNNVARCGLLFFTETGIFFPFSSVFTVPYVVKNSCACVVYMLLEYLESYLNIFRCVPYLYNYCLLCDELSFSALACVATLSLLFVFLDRVMCEGGGGKG
jgi:hypothetical protein